MTLSISVCSHRKISSFKVKLQTLAHWFTCGGHWRFLASQWTCVSGIVSELPAWVRPDHESQSETVLRGWFLSKRELRHAAWCCAVHPLTRLIILFLGVKGEWRQEEEGGGGGGGEWLANPTSPVDREQMGPDTLHTNHCQGSFSGSRDRFKMTANVYSNTTSIYGWGNETSMEILQPSSGWTCVKLWTERWSKSFAHVITE